MRPRSFARATVVSVLVLAGVGAPVGAASAAPCPWGTQCNEVTMVTPKANDVLAGTAVLEARATQTTPARGNIYKVEWWLYHPSFREQTPANAEGKILLFEATAPTSGTRMDGTWRGTWTVASSMTTRDGAYDLPGVRTYNLPNDGRQYSVEAHVLDDEWVRTWGGPSGRTPPVNVAINFPGGPPPPPPPPPTDGQVQVGAGRFLLSGTDIYRAADTLVRYNRSATQTVSPANQWGTEAAVSDGRVTSVRVRNGGAAAMPIPTGGYVLSGHGQAAEFLNMYATTGAVVTLPGQTPPSPSPTPTPTLSPTPTPAPTPTATSSPSPSPEPSQPSSVTIAGSTHPLAGLNIFRSAGTLVRYTRTGSQTVSPANQWGVEATVVGGTVTEMHTGAPASPIPSTSGAYVLSGHDGAGDWLFANAKVGSTVTLGGSTPPPPPDPTPGCDAPQWQGSYYPNIALSGTPSLVRCDPAVDFSWPGTQGPVAAFGGSSFSARWVSRPTFAAGEYAFTVTGDDGIRVTLDGATIIDQWKDQAAATFTVSRTVAAGQHTLVVEYYEKYGDAFAKFSYTRSTGTAPAVGPGQWQVVPVDMPIRALHGTLLRDGRVLLIAGSGNDPNAFAAGTFRSVVWNPSNNSFLSVATPKDMFCSGHVTLPDGRVLVAGGTTAYPGVDGGTAYLGGAFSYVFDPSTNSFTRTTDMMEGHWYPTLTKLENGNVWAAGGYSERGDGASWNTEMFEASRGAWLTAAEVPQSGQNWGTYPHMFLLADGRMFYTGGHTFGAAKWNAPTGAQIYDWRTRAVGDIAGLRDKELRDQAGSVILPPAQNQTFMIVGGGSTDNGGATNKADVVNMNEAVPRYRPAPDLPGPGRQYLNLTTLPDRTVLASNGGATPRGGNVLDAAIYRPTDGTWTPVAADPVGRNYHSASLLLPDGRVAVFGSNPADNSFEMRISIYSPEYMQGSRPTVASVSTGSETTYGESFDLAVTGDVVAASLISPGSSTHQTDTNARLVDLPITGSGTTRRATTPANAALLPPGPYMLTVVSSVGIPSVARWINVR